VFLTTQYLEEADELAGRIAIIDHGRIVREGAPSALKAAVGAPTLKVEVGGHHLITARAVLAEFGPERVARPGVLAIGLERGAAEMTAVVRRLDEAGVTLRHLELDAPTLDDVFAEATGYRLEGSTEPAPAAGDGAT
jgi:ABC-2 type transport system ATP-binding protein